MIVIYLDVDLDSVQGHSKYVMAKCLISPAVTQHHGQIYISVKDEQDRSLERGSRA